MSFFTLSPVVQLTAISCAFIVFLIAAFNRRAAANLIHFLRNLLNLLQRWSMCCLRQNRQMISQANNSHKEIMIKRISLFRMIDEEPWSLVVTEERDEVEIMETDCDGE